jgi:3-oxoacyl-[acyl-carrier-protein] synthase II
MAPPIDAADLVPPAERHIVDRFVLMALAAARDALADAGLVIAMEADPYRTAVVLATGAGGTTLFEEQSVAQHERGRRGVSPLLQQGSLANMAAARIAIEHGIRGYSAAIAAACASGAHAVAEALRLIREGVADVVVCGGSESPFGPTAIASFANARALATRWAVPAEACRPFDLRRNGLVLAEGAAVLVVENAAHAAARGAAGYAELAGWGASTDAYHLTSPRPDGKGAAHSMSRALDDAGLGSADVGYLNAHGTGTRLGDVAECAAINDTFGGHHPAVSSTKAATGHLLGAAGAFEAAVTAMALAVGTLPPTRNLDEPDPRCDLDHVRGKPRVSAVRAALSNSFAFGGHNVSLVFTHTPTRQQKTQSASLPAGPK